MLKGNVSSRCRPYIFLAIVEEHLVASFRDFTPELLQVSVSEDESSLLYRVEAGRWHSPILTIEEDTCLIHGFDRPSPLKSKNSATTFEVHLPD